MEKNREGRRGGLINNRHISTSRRSRTSGLRYSSVSNEDGDDMIDNETSSQSRVQDRPKKYASRVSSSLHESDSHKDTERANQKKRRVGSPHNNHVTNIGSGKDRGYGSDDAEMGRSDEEYDDLPPPSHSSRPWKLKLHTKVREELSPIDPAVVPRKLRTAMTKRQHPSPYNSQLMDSSKQLLSNNSTTRTTTHSFSNIATFPNRKKKLENQKPSTSKSVKVSSSKVSKTEAEVAETLFDLSRMFATQSASSNSDVKSEPSHPVKSAPANSATRSDVKPSPGVSSIDGASQSSTPAPRNKRQRPNQKAKDEEMTQVPSPELTNSELAAYPCYDRLGPVSSSMVASPDINTDSNNPVLGDGEALITDASSPASGEVRSISQLQEKTASDNLVSSRDLGNKKYETGEKLISIEEKQKVELITRSRESTPLESGQRSKVSIDLMTVPKDVDKADGIFESNMEGNENGESRLKTCELEGSSRVNVVDVKGEEKVDMTKMLQKDATVGEKDEGRKFKTSDSEKESKCPIAFSEKRENFERNQQMEHTSTEKNLKVDMSKDRGKQEINRQVGKGTNKTVENESCVHRMDNCDAVSVEKSMAAAIPPSTQLPISGMGGWQGHFPPFSYYPPMAAAAAAAMAASWLKPVAMTGVPSNESSMSSLQIPPMILPPRQPRKRCATHVYITYFIDWQEHLKSNPLWAAAYANSPWNHSKDKGPMEGGVFPTSGVKEKNFPSVVDQEDLKMSSHQKFQGTQKKMLNTQNGSVLGLPMNMPSSASTIECCSVDTSVANGLLSAAMLSSGSSASASAFASNSSFVSAGNGVLDGNIANAAVLQAQLLNSVIQQQQAFPFSIAPAHFGSAYGGQLLPQQVPPIFRNPFFDANLASQQPANTKSASAFQKQLKNSQGASVLNPTPSQFQQMSLPQSLAAQQEKNSAEDKSSAKTQMPILQRNAYGIASYQPAALASSLPGLSMYSQDFGLMSAIGAMHTGKHKQQTDNTSHSQQSIAIQNQKQQKPYCPSQYSMVGSALQPDLKGIDSKVAMLASQGVNVSRCNINSDTGISSVTSTMALQGHNPVEELRGHTSSSKHCGSQMISGQNQQCNKYTNQDSKHHQQQISADGRISNEASYPSIGHVDQQKMSMQSDTRKQNNLKSEWEASQFSKGPQKHKSAHSTSDSRMGVTATSGMLAFSENTASQLSGSAVSQALRFTHASQDSQLSNPVSLPGSFIPEMSNNPSQYLQGNMSKNQGQQTRSEQSPSSTGTAHRATGSPMLSSSSTNANLMSPPSGPKSGQGAASKVSGSSKTSHMSPQKAATPNPTLKAPCSTNLTSFLGSGQTPNTFQGQLNQSHFSIQQHQQYQNLRMYPVQIHDSAQKHHGQSVLQNYQAASNYPNNLQKQNLPQQRHQHLGQHHLVQQPLQNEAKASSQAHSQGISQQQMLHHQKSSRVSPSSSQQYGSIQSQQCNQSQPAFPTSFGNASNIPHNTGALKSTGHSSKSTASEGASPLPKPTGEHKMSCSIKANSNNFPSLSQSHNNGTFIMDQSSKVISMPYSSPGTADLLGENARK